MTIKSFIFQYNDFFWFAFCLGSGFAMSSVLIATSYFVYSLRSQKLYRREFSELLIVLLFFPGMASFLAWAAAIGYISEGDFPTLGVFGLFLGGSPLYLAYRLYQKQANPA
jgi:drug/metabolite transporter (DMT)-like permease